MAAKANFKIYMFFHTVHLKRMAYIIQQHKEMQRRYLNLFYRNVTGNTAKQMQQLSLTLQHVQNQTISCQKIPQKYDSNVWICYRVTYACGRRYVTALEKYQF
jgi:hypothetical protein